MKNPVKIFTNLIFPPRCVFCHKILEPNNADSVCAGCRLGIRYCADSLCCVKCGKPVVSYGEEKMCYMCLNTKHSFNRAVSALVYEGNVRNAVIRNKKRCVQANVAEFARLMSITAEMNYKDIVFDGIVSAPPSVGSVRKKGYDHIAVISEEISHTLGIPHIKNCLKKIKRTPRQSQLKFNQRRENLCGSIACVKDVENKTILFVDDVLTSGGTADECAIVLKRAGAKAVYAVTLATTVKKYV